MLLDKIYVKVMTGQPGGKINYFFSLNKTPRLLIMGNSRAFYQIIPDSFRVSSYNISHAGTDDSFNSGLLSLLLEKNKKPEVVLLQIDPGFYSGTSEEDDVHSSSVEVLRYYYGKNQQITDYINQINFSRKYFYLLKLYRYNNSVINIFYNYLKTRSGTDISKTGYGFIQPSRDDSSNTLYSAAAARYPAHKFAYKKMKYLKTIVSLCEKNNVKLILFSSPYYDKKMAAYLQPEIQGLNLFAKQNHIHVQGGLHRQDDHLPVKFFGRWSR